MRILIADDHPIVRRGLKEILASERDMVVVGEATNGDDALDMGRKLEWDVAVLDYSMPGCSGADLVKEIKRQHPGRPVLVLSMLPEEVHAGQVFKAGGAGYINKESASEELTGAIRKVMNGGKYVSPAFAEKLASELSSGGEKPPHEMLSDREYRVMWLMASGKQINEIAAEMFLSSSTISTYRARILKKLGLSNNAALVRDAVKHRLIGAAAARRAGACRRAATARRRRATKRSSFRDSEPASDLLSSWSMGGAILIVEDELVTQRLIAASLERAGHQVTRAGNVPEAEAAIRGVLPDLVLLDWILPNTTGVTFVRQLRTDQRTKEIPIIMLTGRSEE